MYCCSLGSGFSGCRVHCFSCSPVAQVEMVALGLVAFRHAGLTGGLVMSLLCSRILEPLTTG